MTEPNTAPGTTPDAPQTPVQNPPPAAKTEEPKAEPKDSAWFNKRIEQAKTSERNALLKELGVANVDEAKAFAKAAKDKAEAEKSATQKADELAKSLEAERAEKATLLASTKEYAARMMVGLTDEQKAAVVALAGEDPAKQVSTIAALSPTWAKGDAKAGDGADKPGVTNTAPPPGAPNGSTPPPATPRAAYESIRQTNPFAAAVFGHANPDVYQPK